MSFLTSSLLEETGLVRVAMSTRNGGVSPPPRGMNLSFRVGDDPRCVEENRRRLLGRVGAQNRLALPGQVHSTIVRRVDEPGLTASCDALVTDVRGLVLGVTVADCLPVFLLDPLRPAVAAVHAGWRGAAGNIVAAAVSMLISEYGSNPGDLLVWVGPGAGACCYEVGEEVASRFAPEVVVRKEGRLIVDLQAAVRRQLLASGVQERRLEVSPHCTIHESSLLHSYRRDGDRSGRMMGVIRLLPAFR